MNRATLANWVLAVHRDYRNLQKAHFGSRSKKQKKQTVLPADCEQLSIFNEAEDAADAKAKDTTALPESTVEVKSHRRAKKRSREELLERLPVEVHEYELPAEEMTCRRCGHALEKIGREYIRKECEYIPAQVKVHEYYRATYACRSCEDGMPECEDCERADTDICASCESRPGMILVKAEIPEEHRYPVLKHSIASASTVAQVLYDKYVMAIPLYRQVQDWERAGLKNEPCNTGELGVGGTPRLLRATVETYENGVAEEQRYPLRRNHSTGAEGTGESARKRVIYVGVPKRRA